MKKFDYILIAILVLLIVVAYLIIQRYDSDSQECISNPLGYSIKVLEKQTNSNVSCSCSNGNAIVYFDNNGVTDVLIKP